MTLARYSPTDSAHAAEDVEIIAPAAGAATGDAYSVYGLDTGWTFLAWADELTFVADPAEVLR